MIVAPVATKVDKADVPPTAPKETVPPVPPFKVKLLLPLIVLVKVMLAPAGVPPALVVSATTLPFRVTGPVIVMMPPLVVTLLPKLIAVDPV